MVSIEVAPAYGYVLACALALVLQQQLLFMIAVIRARRSTGIKAPTLYPRDTEIKALKLSDHQVNHYMRAQRAHQNNVEFLTIFLPVYIIAGLFKPMYTAFAGVAAFIFRGLFLIGYLSSPNARRIGGMIHLCEFFVWYTVGKGAYDLVKQS